MLQSYVVSSILTLSLTYSWYSFYGVQYLWRPKFPAHDPLKKVRIKPSHNVPGCMWDIYKNGVNSSEIDVVKGVFPKFVGNSFKSRSYRNHRRTELEFIIPESKPHEILIKSELRLTSNRGIHHQIYVKTSKWIFLDEKKVSDDWVSLKAMPKNGQLGPGSVTFMILTLSRDDNPLDRPILLLSYFTSDNSHGRNKRSVDTEDYEEETNKIWEDEDFPEKFLTKRQKTGCRRKPLYIKFSDIDYDSWIVAPTGYEAFQCVGKCTFPVGEHLSPTKHAILQTLLHNISPSKASRACCVPTRLEPISILYIDGNGVLTYRFRYRDMVVAECGCR